MSLKVPNTEESEGRLVVSVNSFLSDQPVHLQQEPLLVLVSPDKPLYKPGHEVRFRVLSLTHKLKPHNGKVETFVLDTESKP